SAPAIARDLDALSRGVDALGARAYPPQSAVYDSLQGAAFDAAALIAACPAREGDLVRVSERLRDAVKAQSRRWDPSSAEARARLYTLLYGTRAAVEAVMVRAHDGAFALVAGSDAPSATPAAAVRGVTVHSGDLLLSRGGYPTSALIARGSDFPGEFSHVALVHVDSATHAVSVVEAHIERGVAVSTVEQYLGDAKLRILLLRPRADLPALVRDPMLPHRAAGDMLARARREHIPYDFTMDQRDPEALFCSEVASAAYGGRGVGLWPGLSTISAPGLRRWLAEFGVTHFETEEPSDLEYDPQLVVVAEWRDPSALLRGQIDDAVVDAMLERANAGWDIPYKWWQLPLARLAKGWSAVLNAFGKVGPVPEGMSASGALRQKAFMRVQRETVARVTALANDVRARTGAPPPYWVLLALARASVDAPVSP
ncbi:MAG TPA: YiiX/YebB-like N1pC/P60 family cysteine hydrolase, partial [Gemmatimonadaceae bacterium]|nr:YiiX/YebB-like N1pC/P60 family cysteine hydrolase [Gemmatimonadaceae bacterium]